MATQDIALMAHLLRRAAFGASRDEIEARAAKGYEATVEEFLTPDQQPELEEDLLYRLQPSYYQAAAIENNVQMWRSRSPPSPGGGPAASDGAREREPDGDRVRSPRSRGAGRGPSGRGAEAGQGAGRPGSTGPPRGSRATSQRGTRFAGTR